MTGQIGRGWKRWLTAFSLLCLLVRPPSPPVSRSRSSRRASQFENAERMREELNGLPQQERSRREYQRVMDAYRRVYYTAPSQQQGRCQRGGRGRVAGRKRPHLQR